MVSLHDAIECVIFVSYLIVSSLVFFVYARHFKYVDTNTNRVLVITAGLFLMLCAFTHLHSIWRDENNIYLSASCAVVSFASATSSLLSFKGLDDYLSMRITTIGVVREKLVRELGDGYDLRGTFCRNMMVEGYNRQGEIGYPVEFTGMLERDSLIKIEGHYYRITHIVESSVDVTDVIEHRLLESPVDVRYIVFGQDATAEVHMSHEQERINRMRMEMCMSTAHDVRTPLSSLGIVISCLQSMGNDESNIVEYEKLLDEAYVNVEMINLIITQFMEIGRMDGKDDIKPTICFMDMDTMKDRITKVGSRLKGENVIFTTDFDVKIPSLYSDAEWVWQIVLNLVTNATKYTYHGYINVLIQYKAPDLIIRVVDTGIGISEKDKEKIFGKFVTQKSFGHDSQGIGLYSVKTKVDKLGGSLTVRDNTVCGSVFEVKIPVINGDVTLDTIGPQNSSKSCLVVEDTPSIRKMMKRLLRNHEVDMAFNGDIGLEMMKAKQYDIVLLDMYMPVMDGLECIKRFRVWESAERVTHQVIYSMSANQHILDEKFDGTLPKPIDGKRLKQVLDRL